MAAIGPGWVDGAWVEAGWITGAWGEFAGAISRILRNNPMMVTLGKMMNR